MRRQLLIALGALASVAQAQNWFYSAPPGTPLTPTSVKPYKGAALVEFVLNVTLSYGAPSCFARPIVLVNGIFEPAIVMNQGDYYRVKLINNLPSDFPSVSDGLSIHYHGLRMEGTAAWLDGVSYVDLCPIKPGMTFEYEFQIVNSPGSYFWHDHNAGFKGDGLKGPFIILPPRATPPKAGEAPLPPLQAPAVPDLWEADGDYTLLLSDWYHATTSSMFFRLNMPFDGAKVTPDTGSWNWIGNPQAILVNGQGFYGDCTLYPGLGGNTAPPPCAPPALTVPPGRSALLPWASSNNPGCTHSVFNVEEGKTYRLRLINGGILVYMTVCFEGHNVTAIAADGMPVQPVEGSCVDVNNGQRVDVLLTANQPAANYWITVASQFRTGAPAGYAMLSYAGANATVLPATPVPQPANITANALAPMYMLDKLLTPSTDPAVLLYAPKPLAPPPADQLVVVNLSQPLLPQGQLRWALNNVATTRTPPCGPLLSILKKDPKYLAKDALQAPANGAEFNGTAAGPNVGIHTGGSKRTSPIYYEGTTPAPLYPSVGLHIVELSGGKVIDVIVNNGPANGYNGDYRTPGVGVNRTAQEQHPFHLHGHHFWVLGQGLGRFDPDTSGPTLNSANPALRDTVTIPMGGWAYLRFVADNPGIWPFHCHIASHVFMGQQLYFVEDIGHLAPPPSKTPKCGNSCRSNFAPYLKSWLRSKWGTSGWELPPLY
ncbi:hypothetical protein HYH03_000299 [Edaphochlamys debaryana]|uniref:Laccase n=1 Tax=Edaphochlamys debaryana TaxID=47281 RepID=A0A835YQ48_9CHLO|nr:hypothetical protein HYH03_000299 [Edaphochlamys debaryana]|eukprot:KAG2501799.1 hypothetical protein HYH03_000299 [Edaphochlamys debaryana]